MASSRGWCSEVTERDSMTTVEVVDRITVAYERLNAAVDALGDRASTVGVTETDDDIHPGAGGWTAKDVLGHLIHYAGQIAFGLRAPVQPPAYVLEVTERLSAQEWNDRAVDYWRGFSLPEVRTELDTIVGHITEQARKRTDQEMNAVGTIPWEPEWPLWRFIGGDTFLSEWPVHSEQIERAVRRRLATS